MVTEFYFWVNYPFKTAVGYIISMLFIMLSEWIWQYSCRI